MLRDEEHGNTLRVLLNDPLMSGAKSQSDVIEMVCLCDSMPWTDSPPLGVVRQSCPILGKGLEVRGNGQISEAAQYQPPFIRCYITIRKESEVPGKGHDQECGVHTWPSSVVLASSLMF